MKYRVRLAEFREIDIEAESEREAEDIVAVMEDDEIDQKCINHTDMEIWDTWKIQGPHN